MTAFVGLDLAWTNHRESGLCVLRDGADDVTLERLDAAVFSTAELADLFVALGPDVIAAIDAPLMLTDERHAERELGRAFGARKAGAYLATRSFLTGMDALAGPDLAAALLLHGFNFDPGALWLEPSGRHALEVYPHAAHVSLFDLPERILYKKGRVDVRRRGLQALQAHLATLLARELPLVAMAPEVVAVLAPAAPLVLRGASLKHLEDQLDALTCAYTAVHAWRHRGPGTRVFGGWADGSIAVPAWPPDARP